MSMKKYLENVRVPEFPPGPFSVRLKYELKKEFFDRRRSWFPAFSAAVAALMLALLVTVVIQPDLADRVHYAFIPQVATQTVAQGESHGKLLSDAEYRQTVQRLHTIASEGRSPAIQVRDLQDLDTDKSYLIRRTTDDGNRSIYFVSEIKSRPKMY